MAEHRFEQTGLIRVLALCGVAAPVLFAVLVVAGGLFYEGYSHVSQAVSELGGVEAEHPIVQNLNFSLTGLLIMALAAGLYGAFGPRNAPVAGLLLIGFFGLNTTVAQPILPCDPGCDWQTLTGILHNATGLTSFLAMIAGILLVSRHFRKDTAWRAVATPSVLTGVAALLALIAWIGIAKAAEVESLNGALQRVYVAIVLGWTGAAGLWLLRVSPSRAAD